MPHSKSEETTTHSSTAMSTIQKGVVIQLDRGFPLVKLNDGSTLRCKHAAVLEKEGDTRAVIGDKVEVSLPPTHDKGIITHIDKRLTQLVRLDPSEKTTEQVLAANFNLILVVEPCIQLNLKRLERELVLAHESGAEVAVILTKADLCDDVDAVTARVQEFVGAEMRIMLTSITDADSIEALRALIPQGCTAILVGISGVGKSSLVNALVRESLQETREIRSDGKGRHTTINRVSIDIPNSGTIIDMPGMRSLGLWDAETGINKVFADIEQLALSCRFRDCKHDNEPDCAVKAAVEAGELSQTRLDSYKSLQEETTQLQEKRCETKRLRDHRANKARFKKH